MNTPRLLVRPNPSDYREFQKTFHRNLNEFWLPSSGFDLLLFDDEIIHAKGVSIETAITEKFGNAAARLIHRLIWHGSF